MYFKHVLSQCNFRFYHILMVYLIRIYTEVSFALYTRPIEFLFSFARWRDYSQKSILRQKSS